MVVLKYSLHDKSGYPFGTHSLRLGLHEEVLSVGVQDGLAKVWTVIDYDAEARDNPENVKKTVKLLVVGTGPDWKFAHPKDEAKALRFVGTLPNLKGGLVAHVFEVI